MQAYIAGVGYTGMPGWKSHRASVVVFFVGCNFKCPACFNSEILSFSEDFLTDTKEIKLKIDEFLSKDKGLSKIDSAIMTGGEPTLQRQALLSIARFCKSRKLAVRLETNGTKPDSIKSMIAEGLADSVCLDIKSPPEPAAFERLTRSQTFFKSSDELIKDIHSSIKLLRENEEDLEIEIRTPIDGEVVSSLQQVAKIAESIGNIKCIWKIYPMKLCDSAGRQYSGESSLRLISELKKFSRQIAGKYPEMRIEIE
jgi:anaerobic ribonucleoside-triphosphate reductase activating protein